MKILITGCHGQLGTELQKQLADEECALGPLPERLRKATVIAVMWMSWILPTAKPL